MDCRRVGSTADHPVESIHLPHQVTLAEPADCRIAAHRTDLRQVETDESRMSAHPRRRAGRLNASVPAAWIQALRLLETGAVNTETLISHSFAVTDWQEAFDHFERKEGIKLLLTPADA